MNNNVNLVYVDIKKRKRVRDLVTLRECVILCHSFGSLPEAHGDTLSRLYFTLYILCSIVYDTLCLFRSSGATSNEISFVASFQRAGDTVQ